MGSIETAPVNRPRVSYLKGGRESAGLHFAMRRKMVFADRAEAGGLLAERLAGMALPEPVVLALPRGGVPVGAEIARRLAAPLDVALVRKLGAPDQPELA